MHQNKQHAPVMLGEVLKYLDPKKGDSLLDLTAGYGGHAGAILGKTKNPEGSVLVDRDQGAIEALTGLYAGKGAQILHQDFLSASRELLAQNRSFDLILADLGVSSPHLNEPSRGFGLKNEGPLDMRMDQSQKLSAWDIVNNYPEAKLAGIIKLYGEDPKYNRIAHLIVSNRPIQTTSELASVVARAWPGYQRIHPATRTFQAIRIAVNDELNLLEQSLPIWINLLFNGGRIAIISFHSLEDRLVKQAFSSLSGKRYDAELEIKTKKPVTAGQTEIVFNPRARSAKLRAAVKINKKGEFNAYPGKK